MQRRVCGVFTRGHTPESHEKGEPVHHLTRPQRHREPRLPHPAVSYGHITCDSRPGPSSGCHFQPATDSPTRTLGALERMPLVYLTRRAAAARRMGRGLRVVSGADQISPKTTYVAAKMRTTPTFWRNSLNANTRTKGCVTSLAPRLTGWSCTTLCVDEGGAQTATGIQGDQRRLKPIH